MVVVALLLLLVGAWSKVEEEPSETRDMTEKEEEKNKDTSHVRSVDLMLTRVYLHHRVEGIKMCIQQQYDDDDKKKYY